MSSEINKLIMRAVTDATFREEFLANPVDAAKKAGTTPDGLQALKGVNMIGLRKTLTSLSSSIIDVISPVAAGHSKDWNDSNIHDKDDHIHDKNNTSLGDISMVSNPSDLNIDALKAALKDPVVRKEFMANRNLSKFIKENGL